MRPSDDERYPEELMEAFGRERLDAIECAFEGTRFGWTNGACPVDYALKFKKVPTEDERFGGVDPEYVDFLARYKSPRTRLLSIMLEIAKTGELSPDRKG